MRIRGYASIFGNVDTQNDVVVSGAFSRWISENQAKSLPIFWVHDHMPPFGNVTKRSIGVTTLLAQTELGLYFEGITADTPKANEIAELIRIGAVKGASFGFGKYKNGVYRRGRRRMLTALKPAEITVAHWGVNPSAYVEPDPTDNQPSEEIAHADA